ncbi:ribonucleotide reductase [Spiroplasma helicoides]|uniref:Protein NrdI n=1 Tax=Spiroplasma helicoides TaxID=216938 RepID=A0A1B3SM85_9MOLU|nr:class Ib ribonucleoside-diphosphate reductase assembly flavoprotein NrdI [Spiroplasma helicoides]AOG61041.1 ribonucleotide reductase [Spiroplasma helicoides]
MHDDVIRIDSKNVKKPKGDILIVYFSSISNNTHRFILKLDLPNKRIPYDENENLYVDSDYVLIVPTYAGGGNIVAGAVPKQVKKFLTDEKNRSFCRGVIASGNTNFGDTFAIAGPILSKKLQVPLLYQFELLGTEHDVQEVKRILSDFWQR